MTVSMVERVARAIEGEIEKVGNPWTSYLGTKAVARAAIEAMRGPTDAMLRACWRNHHPWGENAPRPEDRPESFAMMEDAVRKDQAAMIDAALNEQVS